MQYLAFFLRKPKRKILLSQNELYVWVPAVCNVYLGKAQFNCSMPLMHTFKSLIFDFKISYVFMKICFCGLNNLKYTTLICFIIDLTKNKSL